MIKNEDTFSTKICRKCEDKVADFHEFALQCERTQAMFESHKNNMISDHIHLQCLKSKFNIGFQIKEELKYDENENDNFTDYSFVDEFLPHPEKCEKTRVSSDEITVKRKRGRPKRSCALKPEYSLNENKSDDDTFDQPLAISIANMERLKNSIKIDNNSNTKSEHRIENINNCNMFSFNCHLCELECRSWNSLKLHVKRVHGANARVICICFKALSSRRSLWRHWLKHNPEKCINRCKSCHKTFVSEKELDAHMQMHLPKDQLPYVCCKCAKRFSNPRILKEHEKIHIPREQRFVWTCEMCETKFATKGALGTHIKVIHEKIRPYMCDLCGHSFSTKANLKEHSMRHSSERKFICDKCQKSFKTKGALVRHIDTHRDTAYQCPHCPMLLNSRRTLRNHLFVHDECGIHNCSLCGKMFKRRKDLKNHSKLHTGERPYICPWCPRTFSNGSNCRIHKRRMHPYEFQLAEDNNPYAPTGDKKEIPKQVIHTTIKGHSTPLKAYFTEGFVNNSEITAEDIKKDLTNMTVIKNIPTV
ncbi:uncharacterized protein LOC143922967 isoform X2 [Arctopsyche grandis]|uniref:uncharacterized protein LOC143922967 isoform X2 n=1 Tax=Arctopsyche grandis TaxID=121162 RepID=UPI00406D6819